MTEKTQIKTEAAILQAQAAGDSLNDYSGETMPNDASRSPLSERLQRPSTPSGYWRWQRFQYLSFRKAATALLLSLGLSIAAIFVASPASASAYGYSYWGTHHVSVSKGGVGADSVLVPNGQLFGAIEGKGLRWTNAGGSFLSPGSICNWHFSVQFYEGRRSNNNVQVADQPNQGCSRTGAFNLHNFLGEDAKAGSVCIRLYRDFGGELLTSVCHGIG
jgi:hypothetical protein